MTEEPRPATKALRVLLDSNALFVPLQFGIDIFEGLRKLLNRNFELVLLSPIQQELERMTTQGSPRTRKNAAFALKLAEECTILEVTEKTGQPTDDYILQVAAEHRYPVFTNDRQLKKRLRDINVPVIYVRQKSRLEINGRL